MNTAMNFAFLTNDVPRFNGRKVAVIGAGPSGLTVTGYLASLGYKVEVYDKLPNPGGMMRFSIPAEVIPSDHIQRGITILERKFGVVFHLRTKVCSKTMLHEEEGDHFIYDMVVLSDLMEEYDAVVLCTGSWRSKKLNIPGENLPGVYASLEFLFPIRARQYASNNITLANVKDRVVAITGAGHSAVDVASSALFLGAAKVIMVYRRTLAEAPCGLYEVNRLQELGVEWLERRAIREVLGENQVEALLLENLDSKETYKLPVDILISAIGEEPTPPFQHELGLDNVRKGDVRWLHMTNLENVFVAGDVLTGPTKIGKAIYSALRTAKSLHHWLDLKTAHREAEYNYDADKMPLDKNAPITPQNIGYE